MSRTASTDFYTWDSQPGAHIWDSLDGLMSENLIGQGLRHSRGQSKVEKKKVKDHMIMKKEIEDKT